MKKMIPLLALAASLAVLTPSTSQAGDYHGHSQRSHSHNCGSCGSPVYRERAIVGYDRCGDPIYGWRTVSHSCRSSQGHGSRHGSSRGGHIISLPGFHLDFGGHGGRH